jgi:hypothetical protein
MCRQIVKDDPERRYMDGALTAALATEGQDALKLYSQTTAAIDAVQRERRVAGLGAS